MSLEDLRKRVRLYLQEPDNQGRFSDDDLDLLVNDALRHVADRTDVLVEDAATDVLEGTAAIDLPTSTLGVKLVRWNGVALTETTQNYLDTLGLDEWIEHKGTPARYYTTTPNAIRLYPIPDKEGKVRIRYTRSPDTLEVDEDESELPDFLSMLAPIYATYLAWDSDERPDRGERWLVRFERELELARRRLATRTSVPKGLRVRGEIRR